MFCPTLRFSRVQVLLKIIKHSSEHINELAFGQLLGMDIGNVLEVSHFFPFPLDNDDEREDGSSYQVDMLRALNSQKEDANVVGLFHTTYFSEPLFTLDLIQAQFTYQLDTPNSVCVVFDPFKSQKGRLSLRAVRLTENFMQLYAQGKFVPKAMQKFNINSTSIFEEVPVRVHNSHLIHGFLYNLRESKVMDCTYSRLDTDNSALLAKLVQLVAGTNGGIDEYITEQDRYKQAQAVANRQKMDAARKLEQAEDENRRRQKLGLNPIYAVRFIDSIYPIVRLNSISCSMMIFNCRPSLRYGAD